MNPQNKKTLLSGHRRASGLEEDVPDLRTPSEAEKLFHALYPDLKHVPGPVIRRAWFNMAHLLLKPGSRVAEMGCEDGLMTYAMAVLNPQLHFIGIDRNKKLIAQAKKTYTRDNLEFIAGDIEKDAAIEPGSLDAIINSFTLHEIYSSSRYNERQVAQALEYQFTLLKQDGLMYIRDYALSHPGDYVLLEMPDSKGKGLDVTEMSETELLIWYAENAHPRQDSGSEGFFMEELPARYPRTRLFRLPYKWAYEFIIRKDDRVAMKSGLHKEYAFYTQRDYRMNLRALGARALYTAPHWDERAVNQRFAGHFRLYDDNGRPMGPPPTSFIAVAQKVGERRSLRLQERRPSQKSEGRLRVSAMRNERTGRVVDIATRDAAITEILPYRVSGENELFVYIHESLPRGIVNAVPRTGGDLDGKNWSGHMIEAVSVPTEAAETAAKGDRKDVVRFAQAYLDLIPAIESTLEDGTPYYPAPDFIDEVIKTSYLRVTEKDGPIAPKNVMDDIRGFTSQGQIREFRAQSLLDAIAVGYIPNGRLELQILALYDRLGLEARTWDECPLILEESEPEPILDGQNFVKLRADNDSRFKPVRGTAGSLRTVQSIFVDEGRVDGGITGLASRDMEFILSEDNTLNKAVVIPMTRQAGNLMIGLQMDYMPVAQRHEGNGLMMRAPSLDLPRDITNIHQAKKYIAEQFKVPPDSVWRLGESYFCHIGMTPLRIFPFAIATKGAKTRIESGPVLFAPLRWVWRVYNNFLWNGDMLTMIGLTRARRRLIGTNEMGIDVGLGRSKLNDTPDPVTKTGTPMTGLVSSADPADSKKPRVQ